MVISIESVYKNRKQTELPALPTSKKKYKKNKQKTVGDKKQKVLLN